MSAAQGHGSPSWVLGKVATGDVHRGWPDKPDDYLYRVQGSSAVDDRGQPKTCCTAVYALEDAGLVVLHRDGRVTLAGDGLFDLTDPGRPVLTDYGRTRLAAMNACRRRKVPRRRPAVATPVFQAA